MRYFADVHWTVDDVQTLAPHLTDELAEVFLIENQNALRDVMVERGWEAMQDLLEFAGLAREKSE